MGKKNNQQQQQQQQQQKGGSKNAIIKCHCEDPYKCVCGNRPPRPSPGHKWDPTSQTWGGKGHKQRGGSGQTASVAQQATTTKVGQTQVAQWQRLPSQLVQEVCRKQKRPPAKFKNVSADTGSTKTFQFRIIVPDPKDPKKDLFFVPAHSVGNEEQAMEEAALLALLHLTPNLPHELKLPEPYRTTWIHAVEATKLAREAKDAKTNEQKAIIAPAASPAPPNKGITTDGIQKAQASTNLTMAKSYTSLAEKQKQQQELKRIRNTRIARHEAIRMANQNHPVFMSAQIRKHIEALLRGDVNLEWDEKDDVDPADNDLQEYIEERLHIEGFTRKHARTAFTANFRQGDLGKREDEWEKSYEQCLQWLLVHLDEDVLPEGFDPRGKTLDVVPGKSRRTSNHERNGMSDSEDSIVATASRYGLSMREALLVQKHAEECEIDFDNAFWMLLQSQSGVSSPNSDSQCDQQNNDLLREEIEALKAIFAETCNILPHSNELLSIQLELPFSELTLQVFVTEGHYPSVPPEKVLLTGNWPLQMIGSALHIKVIQFMASDFRAGEPFVFDMHGFVSSLLVDPGRLPMENLLKGSKLEFPNDSVSNHSQSNQGSRGQLPQERSRPLDTPVIHRRPVEKQNFWTTHPSSMEQCVAFPEIPVSIAKVRKALPAATARDEFLRLLKESEAGNRVLLVTGDTGCGKTTQIPQFILEEFPSQCKIVVAQPRRLAATGVATRVAAERGESKPGIESVGYVVRGDSAIGVKTRLVFCTTGVLLRQLQTERALNCVTHVVIDEVHERHLDTDILLGILKKTLTDYSHLRIILMSATLDADRFANYWGSSTPKMHIPGRTFPIKDYTLEDVLKLTGYIPRRDKRIMDNQNSFESQQSRDQEESDEELDGNMSDNDSTQQSSHGISIKDLVKRIDETTVNYDLLALLVKHLVGNDTNEGSILVFLPGAAEIDRAAEVVRRVTTGLPVIILSLHGGLQPKDQNRVFIPAPLGKTKVVLSTNVAETSITIPDCTIVIDGCREKQSSYDPANRMPLLVERFASQASLKQRRGRAGRVKEGACYKLISHDTLKRLPEHSEPEITRCALDQTLLYLLYLQIETGAGNFFGTLLDPPSAQSVEAAKFFLARTGAVEARSVGPELHLTPLGTHLAGIPAPPTIGKLLVMGSILGCREAAIAMAAGMSLGRNPFLRVGFKISKGTKGSNAVPIDDKKHQRIIEARSKVAELVGASDHAYIATIFMSWKELVESGGNGHAFCEKLGLSHASMTEMSQLARQFDSSLSALGFTRSPDSNQNNQSWRIIRGCAVAALAPSQLVKVVRPAAKYQETSEGAKEKEGAAQELKFFIRSDKEEERVFIHPSSANFSNGTYRCPWLVYHTLVRTSKPFLRDITECHPYPLLLFGGKLDVQASKDTVVIDDWVKLAASARIGSLMGGLRRRVDDLLSKKVRDPSFEIAKTKEMELIVKLITTDGLGTM